MKEFDIDLVPLKQEILKFEQPQKVKFRLHNVSDKQMTLQVDYKEG